MHPAISSKPPSNSNGARAKKPTPPRPRADIPACQFPRLPSRGPRVTACQTTNALHSTPKPEHSRLPVPPTCTSGHFLSFPVFSGYFHFFGPLESPDVSSNLHWDHEPRTVSRWFPRGASWSAAVLRRFLPRGPKSATALAHPNAFGLYHPGSWKDNMESVPET